MEKKTTALFIIFIVFVGLGFNFSFGLLVSSYLISNYGIITNTDVSELYVDGKYIKNTQDQVVLLKGVNRAHFTDMAAGAWGGWKNSEGFSVMTSYQINKELNEMQSWGINVIRLCTAIEFWKENPNIWLDGDITKTHKDAIKKVIVEAGKRGMYVVYCPWSVAESVNADELPFPPYTPYTDVIADESEFINYWLDVVNELGVYSNVIWEFYNEPRGDIDVWHNVWQNLINQIRDAGDEHLIVIQWGYGVFWHPDSSQRADLSWIWDYPFTGSNLVYSSHLYRYHASYGSDNPYEYDIIKQRMIDLKFFDVGDELNVPLWIGEIGGYYWGYYNDPLGSGELERLAFIHQLQILNEWDLGYAGWEWWSGTAFSLNKGFFADVSPNEFGLVFKNAILGIT